MDTTFVHTAADSIALYGWLGGLTTQYLSWLPAEAQAALLGAIVSGLFWVLEIAIVWLGTQIPAVREMIKIWQEGRIAGKLNWTRILNPLFLALLSKLITGSWVVAAVAAGLRSVVKAPSNRVGRIVAVLACLMVGDAARSQAQVAPPKPVTSRFATVYRYISLAPGAGVRYERLQRTEQPVFWYAGQIGVNATEHLAARARMTWDAPRGKPRIEIGIWIPL